MKQKMQNEFTNKEDASIASSLSQENFDPKESK